MSASENQTAGDGAANSGPTFTAKEYETGNTQLVPVSVKNGCAQAQEDVEKAVNLQDSSAKNNTLAGRNRASQECQQVFTMDVKTGTMSHGQDRKGTAVHHLQAAELQVEGRLTERVEAELVDGMFRLSRSFEAEYRIRLRYIDAIFIEANARRAAEKKFLEAPHDQEVEEPTRSDKCVDFCCKAVACDFKNTLCFQRRSPRVTDPDNPERARNKEILEMTPALQRGRGRGWDMTRYVSLPICRGILRDAWVILELIPALAAFVLSVVTVSLGNNRVFHIFHLVLSIIATILASLDSIRNLTRCSTYKTCRDAIKNRPSQNTEAPDRPHNAETHTDSHPEVPSTSCGKCMDITKKYSDIIRIFAAELILYPLLVCDLFGFITGQGYSGGSATDVIGFILFLISLFALIFHTYIIRLFVLGSTIYHIQKERKKGEDIVPIEDPTVAVTALVFQLYFFIHVFGQMLGQILMLITIGAKIQYDNRHLLDPNNTDKTIHASSHLWYMLIAGYIMPVCGILTFFLVTYYWTQEFPIGVLVDTLRILEKPDKLRPKDSINALVSKFSTVEKYINYAEIKKDFKKMRNKHFVHKFLYPFRSPLIIILCLAYTGCQLGFIICAAVTVNENGDIVGVYLNGGGWVIYYYLALFIVGLANVYVVLVAGVWLTIIIAVVVSIAIIIGCSILYCLCPSCKDDNEQQC